MADAMRDFYEQVYTKGDNTPGDAHGWVQWKGTEVCIDLHCKCGHHGHFDGGFFYFYQCPACGAKYAVGQVVRLIPLTDAQAEEVESNRGGFQTTELD